MGWLGGWLYRKEITLSRASGAVTNYQMNLTVYRSSGTDSGAAVYVGTKCEADYDDIRFTTADGETLLDYWIKSSNSSSAYMWVEFDSIGTGVTTFYMYYGKADASAVSNGANTFIVFDDFERGNDGDAVGGDWTVASGLVTISTAQHYGNGTRCMKVRRNGTTQAKATIGMTAGDSIYAIDIDIYKDNTSYFCPNIVHGAASKITQVYGDADEDIEYYDGSSYVDTGLNMPVGSWTTMTLKAMNFTAGTYQIEMDGYSAVNANMRSLATYANLISLFSGNNVSDEYYYVDNFKVRNWRATEPAWGSWGTEEYNPPLEAEQVETVTLTDTFEPLRLVDQTAEQVTVTDQFDGDMNRRNVTEQVSITDQMTGFDYHGKQTEAVTITDAMGRAIEAERAVEETITFGDEMEPLHLVDASTEAVTVGDSFVADEMIRKKTRHPRLQGKHLSLKFSSSAAGSFAVYYLRAKVHRTVVLERRPLHPNLQGRHLSLKISHGAEEDFKMYYTAAKMLATKTLSGSVHPNIQGSHIGLTLKHTAAEAFRMDYASMRLMQVKR